MEQRALLSAGDLDLTFGIDGKVTTDIGNFGYERGLDVVTAMQDDGKLLVAGQANRDATGSDFVVARYNADGSLDATFGTDGIVTTDFGNSSETADGIALESDGKIVVVGSSRQSGATYEFAVARYNPDGSLDASFDGDGKATVGFGVGDDFARAVAVAEVDGVEKIVVAGQSTQGENDDDFGLVRFNPDGSLDSSFDGDGKVTTSLGASRDQAQGIRIQSDGKIVVAGRSLQGSPNIMDFAVTRYNVDGSLDTSFDGDGMVTTHFGYRYDEAYDVAIQTVAGEEKIVVAGLSWQGDLRRDDFALARYNADGSLDTSFDGDGLVVSDSGAYERAYGVAVQGERIVVAGWVQYIDVVTADFAVACYGVDGSPDTSFDADGWVTTDFSPLSGPTNDIGEGVAVQEDGKIVVVGYSHQPLSMADITLARYATDGSLDPTFGDGGKVLTDIRRPGTSDQVTGAATLVQDDEKIVVAGDAYRSSTRNDFAVARYNPDGSLDAAFGSAGVATLDFGNSIDRVEDMAIQSDGKVVVAGYSDWDGTYDFAVTRFHPDGSLDTTFGTDGKAVTDFAGGSDRGWAVTIQEIGGLEKIVVAGESYQGGTNGYDFAVARYNPDGTLDTTFSGDGLATTHFGYADDRIESVTVQGDKIVATGPVRTSGGGDDFGLARYDVDGNLDGSFGLGGTVTIDFGNTYDRSSEIKIQSDGKIIVAGYSSQGSTSYDFAMARVDTDGNLDAAFGIGGKVLTHFGTSSDYASGIGLQADGKIVLAGFATQPTTGHDFALARYHEDGSLDETFGEDGLVTTDFGSTDRAYCMTMQADGDIVAAGYTYGSDTGKDFAVARYLAGPPVNSIGGLKWQDLDGDGVRDDGEPGMAGVTIYLDLNDDGELDPETEPSTVTDAEGRYQFSDLAPGDYVIREVVPDGFTQTAPVGGPGRLFMFYNTSPATIRELDPTDGNVINEFLSPAPVSLSQGMAFDGRVLYYMTDGQKVLYELDPDDGTLLDSTPMPSEAVPGVPRRYEGLAPLGGMVYVFDDNLDEILVFNPRTNTIERTFDLNTPNPGVNFDGGLGAIHGPDALVIGTTTEAVAFLDPADGSMLSSFNHSGGFGDMGLAAIGEEVFVGVGTISPGWIEVYDRPGNLLRSFTAGCQVFCLAGGAADSHRVTLEPHQIVTGLDFGNQPLPGEIHGAKWNDLDGDGVRDEGEPGLEGVTIYLDLNNNGVLDAGSVIEPDDFTAGTQLNTIVPGVTLTTVGSSIFGPQVVSMAPPPSVPASTGSLVFGNGNSASHVWFDQRQLRIDFDEPVTSVSIDFIGDNAVSGADVGRLQIFDASGNLLDTYTTSPLTFTQIETMILTRSTADIAYGLAGGIDIGNAGLLDHLVIGSGSEPYALTDADGLFEFTGVTPGDYVVREIPADGYQQTWPEGEDDFFFAIDRYQDELLKINALSGELTVIGPHGAGTDLHGLVRTNSGELFAIAGSGTDSFYSLDPETGAATLIGPTGRDVGFGLAYDSATDTIYGYGGGLLTYDRVTGAATQVGESFEITGTGGIAFDDGQQRIVVYDTKINQFYAFEPDGTPSILAATSTFWSNALAYTGDTFVMSRSFYSGDGENKNKVLLSVDPDTGEVSPWLITSEARAIEALEFVDAPPNYYQVTVAPGGSVEDLFFGNVRVNRPPVAFPDTAATDEETAISIDVLANDSDADGDPLSITGLPSVSQFGVPLLLNADGTVQYDPGGVVDYLAADEPLEDEFTYTIGDGAGGFDSTTVTVTITGVNDPPAVDLNGPDADGIDFAATFVEDAGPVAIADADAIITDLDGGVVSTEVSQAGNVYVANYNGRVTEVDPATGQQTLVYDGSLVGYSNYMAIDDATGALFLADYRDGKIVKVDPEAGTASIVASGGYLGGSGLYGIDVDSSGNLVVVNNTYSRVIKVDPSTGSQQIIASGGQFGYRGPSGLTIDPNGDILVTDIDRDAVIRVDPLDGSQEIVSIGGNFVTPRDIDVDADGNYVVSDWEAEMIIRVDPSSGSQSVVSSGGIFDEYKLYGVAVHASGSIFTPGYFGNMLVEVDPASGSQTVVASGGYLLSTRGIAIDSGTVLHDIVSATMTIVNPLDWTDETLAADTTSTNIAATYDAAAGVLSLTGGGTLEQYQQVLRSAMYYNASETPTTTPRVITVVVNDGGLDSPVATTTLDVVAVNDPPIAGPDSGATDEETPTSIDVLANDSDPEGATVSLDSFPAASDLGAALSLGTGGTILYDPSGALDFIAAEESVEDTFTYVVSDGEGGFTTGTVTVTVTGINDPPAVDLNGPDGEGIDYAGTFIEDAGPVPIADADAAISDVDGGVAGTVVGGDGVIYVLAYSGRVVAVDPETGEQTYVYSGSDIGSYPDGLAFDSTTGLLYIANYNKVLEVDPEAGTCRTVSSYGYLSNLEGIDIGPNGEIYVLDYTYDRIIEINPDSGAQSIVASGGSLYYPIGLTVDTNGNLIVTDDDYHGEKIIRIDPDTGSQVVVSQDGNFDRPEDVVVDAAGNYLVADRYEDKVIRVDAVTGTQTVVSQGNLLRYTYALDVDSAGNILVADYYNELIKVDPVDGSQTQVASGGLINGSMGVAVGGEAEPADIVSATVTLTNPLNWTDETLAADTTGMNITATYDAAAGVLSLTGGGTLDQYQQVLRSATYYNASNTPNTTARVITVVVNDGELDSPIATTTLGVVAVNDPPVAGPDSAATDEDTSTSIDVLANDSDPEGATVSLDSFPAASDLGAALSLGAGGTILYDPSGALDFIAAEESVEDTFTYVVSDGEGGFTTGTVTVTVTGINDPPAVDLNGPDGEGIDYAGTFIEDAGPVPIADADAAISDVDGGVAGTAVGGDGVIYVLNRYGKVVAVDPETGEQTYVYSGSLIGNYPEGLAVDDATGLLYAVNYGKVLEVDPEAGTCRTLASSGYLYSLEGIDIGPNGEIYVIDATYDRVIQVDPDTGGQSIVASGGSLYYPVGITVDPNGNLIVTDDHSHEKIIRIDPDTGGQVVVTQDGYFSRPEDVVVDAAGNYLVADRYADRIIRVDAVTGTQTVVSQSNLLRYTYALDVDSDGNILVADYYNELIKVDPVDGSQTQVASGGLINYSYGVAVGGEGEPADIASATVTLTNPLNGAEETLAVDTTDTNVTAVYDPAGGILSLSGDDTLQNYDAVLRSITYDNASQDPNVTPRIIQVTVNDGGLDSPVATTTLGIVAVNDAPVLTGLSLDQTMIDENETVLLTGTFDDPEAGDTHDVVIVWGDGSPDTVIHLTGGERSFSMPHPYLDDDPSGTPSDPYTIDVTVSDQVGATSNGSTGLTVNNVAPALSNVTTTPEINENDCTTLAGSIVDPGTLDTFTLDLDWGDGSTNSIALGTSSLDAVEVNGDIVTWDATARVFDVTHQYLDDGASPGNGTPSDVYTIVAAVTDDDGGSTPVTVPVSQTISQPKAPGSLTIKYHEPLGQTFTATAAHLQAIAFYVHDANPHQFPDDYDLDYELYEGVGTGGPLLGVRTVTDLSDGFQGFVSADFSSLTLSPGTVYTIIARDDTMRWGLGRSNGDEYSGGTAIVYGAADPSFDAAFEVTFTSYEPPAVTVYNVAPQLHNVAVTSPINENEAATVTGSITDPGLLDGHEVTVDWDDPNASADSTFTVTATAGLSAGDTVNSTTDSAVLTITAVDLPSGEVSFSVQHVYADDGPAPGNGTASDTSTVKVTVSDDDDVGIAKTMYWVDLGNHTIKRADVDGSNVEVLVDAGLVDPFGIAVDGSAGKMYWTDSFDGTIKRANLDGSNIETLVSSESGRARAIALDVSAGKMYWVDDANDTIQRADLDGTNVEILVSSGLRIPIGIALDVSAGKMYWTDTRNDTISRANLDGSNIETLVDAGLGGAVAIALDVLAGKMYWADNVNDTIKRANLDGSNQETLIATDLVAPGGDGLALAVSAGKMYWTDFGNDTIKRADLDGSNVEILVSSGLDDPRGLALAISEGGDTATTTVTVNNVAPSVTVDISTQGVQYSDSIDAVTFTATDVPADVMNAQVFWSDDEGASFSPGLPDALSLEPDIGLEFDGEADQVETGTWTISGVADLAPGSYIIRVIVDDDDGGSGWADAAIEVDPEDAQATYVGPLFVSTDPKDPDNGTTVELRAVIRDITAVEPASDPEAGHVTRATVTFVDRDNGNVIAADVPVNLIDSDITTGVAIFNWYVTLTDTSESYTIGVVVDDFYTRDHADDNVVVTVARPDGDFITGGGYLVNESSGGAYAASDGLKTNFGFNVKFNSTLTNLQGHFNGLIRQEGGTVLQIKSNSTQSLAIDPTIGVEGFATFVSKANLNDVTDPYNPVGIKGALTLIVNVTDNGEPGTLDEIDFTLWDGTELLFSTNWDGAQTVEQLLAGGNVAVHANADPLHVAGRAADRASSYELLTLERLRPVAAAAIAVWSGFDIDRHLVDTLPDVEFRVADLSDTTLGLALAKTVWIDWDAAGYGWSFDRTGAAGPHSGGVDLLSVVTHELGHVLGLEHEDPYDVMAATLAPGVRAVAPGGPSVPWGITGDAVLVGQTDRDIQLGGTSDDDSNDAALLALLEEWDSDGTCQQRLANIRTSSGPVLSGTGYHLVEGATVFNDGDADELNDWFSIGDADKITDIHKADNDGDVVDYV